MSTQPLQQTVPAQTGALTLVKHAEETILHNETLGLQLAAAALKQAMVEKNLRHQAESLTILSLGTNKNRTYIESIKNALDIFNLDTNTFQNSFAHDLLHFSDSLSQQVNGYAHVPKDHPQQQMMSELQNDGHDPARSITSETDHQEKVADSLNMLSLGMYRTCDYEQSLALALEAQNTYRPDTESRLFPTLLNTIGSLYFDFGDYAEALNYFQQQESVAVQRDDKRNKAESLQGQAAVYAESGDLERSLKVTRNSLRLFMELENTRGIVISHNNITNSLWEVGRHEEAVEEARQGLTHCPDEPAFSRLRGVLLTSLSLPLIALHRFDEATEAYEATLQLAEQLNDQRLLAHATEIRGRQFAAMQEHTQARHFLELAIERSEALGARRRTLAIHEVLIGVLKAEGNFEAAMFAYERLMALQKELFNDQVASRMRNLEITHNTQLSQQKVMLAEAYAVELEQLVEQRTAEVLKALEQSQKTGILRRKMIETIMHEFRTPLTVISSSSSLLHHHSHKLNEEKRITLHTRIDDAVKYLAKLLDDVANAEESHTQTLNLQPTIIAASEWSKMLIDTLQTHCIENTQVSFIYNEDEFLEVEIYLELIESIAIELLTNAIKYSPENQPITVAITIDNGTLSITVTDSGIGLESEEIERVTGLFYRSNNAGNIPGVGAGLYTASIRAQAMGGDISISSAGLGMGTSVALLIPIA